MTPTGSFYYQRQELPVLKQDRQFHDVEVIGEVN
jgi:hypothetical protein